jgi:hypothetical protein
MMTDGIKDANDLLCAMVAEGMPEDLQIDQVNAILDEAPTYVEVVAKQAGLARGGEREELVKHVFELVGKMEGFAVASFKPRISKLLGLNIREFNGMVKAADPESGKKGKRMRMRSRSRQSRGAGSMITWWS